MEKEVDGKIGELHWTHDWEKDDELTKLADEYDGEGAAVRKEK